MAKKDTASKILQQMEDGTREIIEKYDKLKKNTSLDYSAAVKKIGEEYDSALKNARSEGRISVSNEMELLADRGLASSGAALQTKLMQNIADKNAVAAIEASRAKALSDAALSRDKEKNSLEYEKTGEVSKYRSGMYEKYVKALSDETDGGTIKPSKSASALLSEIVAANTTVYKDKGYKSIDRKKVGETVIAILEDDMYPESFRHELETYARVNGYIKYE